VKELRLILYYRKNKPINVENVVIELILNPLSLLAMDADFVATVTFVSAISSLFECVVNQLG